MIKLLGTTIGARMCTTICPKYKWRDYRVKEALRTIKACLEESAKQKR